MNNALELLFFVCLLFDYAWRLRYSASRPCVVIQGGAVTIQRHQKMRGSQSGDSRCASRANPDLSSGFIVLTRLRVVSRLLLFFCSSLSPNPAMSPLNTGYRPSTAQGDSTAPTRPPFSPLFSDPPSHLSVSRTYGHLI